MTSGQNPQQLMFRAGTLLLFLAGIIALGLFLPHSLWEQPRFDAFIDHTVATAVFITSVLLILSHRLQDGTLEMPPEIIYGFLMVAILRFLSGTMENIEIEALLRRLSAFALASYLFLSSLPSASGGRAFYRRARLLYSFLGLTLFIGFVVYFLPHLLLEGPHQEALIPLVIWLNAIAGILYLAALGVRLVYWKPGDLEGKLVVYCCAFFGTAAILWPFCTMWSWGWWYMQCLEMLPQMVITLLFFIRYQHQVGEQREQLCRALDSLRRSNAELESFSSVAAHDLSEPLRMVTAYCQLVSRHYSGLLDGRGQEYLGFAVDGAKRMRAMIDGLLGYARVGKLEGRLESVDFAHILEQVLSNLKTKIEEKGAVVTNGALPVLDAEPNQMLQLLQNLIGNAVKYQARGSIPQVEVFAERKNTDWLFRVSDNGIGIDPQYSYKIFEMFEKLHGPNEYPGTGIGLATCKKIVENHGGKIWVESLLGEGSTFYFTLPTEHWRRMRTLV